MWGLNSGRFENEIEYRHTFMCRCTQCCVETKRYRGSKLERSEEQFSWVIHPRVP